MPSLPLQKNVKLPMEVFFTLIIVSSLLRIIIRFNETIKASNKNRAKLTDPHAVCFVYNIFFVSYFCSGNLYSFNQSLYCFLREKVGGSEKSRLLCGSEPVVERCGNWSSTNRRYRHCSK